MTLRRLILGVFLLPLVALADEGARATPILPQQFGGWQMSGKAKVSQDPASADPTNASLLKEYGFIDFESATYVREDGRKLTIKAARFADTSGAYGAFTYYRSPEMLDEKIGNQGASLNERALFYRGNMLVDAVFQRLSAMSAAELRELSGLLPLVSGVSLELPPVIAFVPNPNARTSKYVLGPVGLQRVDSPIPSELVDFGVQAEAATGRFSTSTGEATWMLIYYPTVNLAALHLRRIEAAAEQNKKQPGSVPGFAKGEIFVKRTGVMVALVAGTTSSGDAQSWLASVNYDANVTLNEKNPFDKRNNIGDIVWNALLLCGILIVLMLVAGVAFGGVRVAMRRFFPSRLFGREEDVQFISLHLEEGAEPTSDRGVKSLN